MQGSDSSAITFPVDADYDVLAALERLLAFARERGLSDHPATVRALKARQREIEWREHG